ncbi:malonate decarboxylase holo-[acyl-carrier-protein] synthase [Bradyrhizobium sp. SSUT112]|uniref:malonate decarboxylase holo-[acyl-carrier-protein] synthase n=1 Tax=Bradyrhizobium sp. SSUT112 TaxID=3040604 RepID=UPI00244A6E7C|nr:malonate decarboxylase holo-[acyl-carrier-protein] synthase [Bradyrhizobium sp. SSUT112]MDH2350449.1 malonate decarboxylase holo-[acyl-carrier-protein] synthase [Bradyrhizobium sp. SSUT112]
MADPLERHTMVKTSAAAWTAVMARHPEFAEHAIVEGWARDGRPLIVRRPGCSDPAGKIPLGLPLPPSHGKRRIAVALDAGEIIEQKPPPLLADAAASAPAAWQDTIGRLVRLCPETRTFGSLAWQHLTGLPYLSDHSDLDLLWPARATEQASTLPLEIAGIARQAPMRLDGEIICAAGGVQWRELTGTDADEVLVKRQSGVHSTTRAAFLAGGTS